MLSYATVTRSNSTELLQERLRCREVASLGGGVPPQLTVALAQASRNDGSESNSGSVANVKT